MVDREKLMTTLQYRINEARNKGSKVTTIFISTLSDCMTLLNEQQEQIDRLIEENASNSEMADGLKELLKEQEETELCDRCGRVRLKSKWEGR